MAESRESYSYCDASDSGAEILRRLEELHEPVAIALRRGGGQPIQKGGAREVRAVVGMNVALFASVLRTPFW
ncbi:MAG: hypothetical protein ACAI35_22870 [Candidatus Methylacidiphilales bacterium]|nr:hypothetical protein [Candidatus Methylacidiphilales bacterium]